MPTNVDGTGGRAAADYLGMYAGSVGYPSLSVNVRQSDAVRIIIVTGFPHPIIWLAHETVISINHSKMPHRVSAMAGHQLSLP